MLHAVQIFYILPALGKSKYISCTVLYLMLFYNFIIYQYNNNNNNNTHRTLTTEKK